MTRARKSPGARRPIPSQRAPSKALAGSGTEKLQKVLADLGLGSRREMGTLDCGRRRPKSTASRRPLVIVFAPTDRVRVDGIDRRRGEIRGERGGERIILLNKAEGVICTRNDPEGRPTCFDSLPRLGRGRWVSVGRLDINSSGLLLFTTDGNLAHTLMHPSTGIDREYAVRVDAELMPETMKILCDGVLLEDGDVVRFATLRHAGGTARNHWYHVTLEEGRNREVRRLFESQGLRV
ncbi:MAG: pseudouridine synthase, partial [Gammaproteobacteria bacterium]|nr:pseudouridine synthase [Gammaproteobacteria bacterium]